MSLGRIRARAIVLGALATLVLLVFGVAVSIAADYQDEKHNVCEGTFSAGSCEWGTHVEGTSNVALGDAMMPALTSGRSNVALDFGALASDTEGNANVASASTR